MWICDLVDNLGAELRLFRKRVDSERVDNEICALGVMLPFCNCFFGINEGRVIPVYVSKPDCGKNITPHCAYNSRQVLDCEGGFLAKA